MKTLLTQKDKLQDETTPKKEVNLEQERAIAYLQKTYRPTDGSKLDVKPLWGNAYRLNFWHRKEMTEGRGVDNIIARSLFLRIDSAIDGFDVKVYN